MAENTTESKELSVEELTTLPCSFSTVGQEPCDKWPLQHRCRPCVARAVAASLRETLAAESKKKDAALRAYVFNSHNETNVSEGKHSRGRGCQTCFDQYMAGLEALPLDLRISPEFESKF